MLFFKCHLPCMPSLHSPNAYLAKGTHTDLSIKERHLPTDFVLIMKMHSGQGHPDVLWQLEFKSFFCLLFSTSDSGKSPMHYEGMLPQTN